MEKLKTLISHLTDDQIDEVYAKEVASVADIRKTEADLAKVGFDWLIREVACVAVYLGLVGLVAAGVDPLVSDAADTSPTLTWTVTDSSGRSDQARGTAELKAGVRATRVQLAASAHDDVGRVQMHVSTSYRCIGRHGGATAGKDPEAPTREVRDDGRPTLTLTQPLADAAACALGTKRIVVRHLLKGASESTGGALSRASLVVVERRAP
jgi:hypothetical protein